MYGKAYYQKHQHGSYVSAMKILGYLTTIMDFESIIDFGCGMGTWCFAAQELGVTNIIGIDQHPYDGDYLLISHEQYMQMDLQTSIALNYKADLAVSVEVGEHIDDRYSAVLVGNLCTHSDVVLFSAALPHQGGTGHINEKPCSYWRDIFRGFGFHAIDCVRAFCWEDDEVEVWYKNNCILYAKDGIHINFLKKIKNITPPMDIIHPDMLERIIMKRSEQ